MKMNADILQHDQFFKDNSAIHVNYLKTVSDEEKNEMQKKILLQRFEGCKTKIIKNIKITKIPTHITTLDLLKENLSLESIAKKRQLTIGTIIGHIEKLKESEQIDDALLENIKSIIPKNDFNIIFEALEKSEDGSLKEIVDQFQGKYSYIWVKIVRLFIGL